VGPLPRELCDPLVWKYHQQLNSSSKPTDIPRPKASTRPSIEAWQHLTNFVRTRELTALHQALSEDFLVMGYPLVMRQIHYLFSLTNLPTIEEVQTWGYFKTLDGWRSDPQIVAAPTQQQAWEALQYLLSGWVGRVLPGYTIEKKQMAKKSGRPEKLAWGDKGEGGVPLGHHAFDEYERLREKLEEIYNEHIQGLPEYKIPYFWKPDNQEYESEESFFQRMDELIAEINQDSWFGHEYVRIENEYRKVVLDRASPYNEPEIRQRPTKGAVLCRFRDLFELKEVPRKKVSTRSVRLIPKYIKKVLPIPQEEVTKIIQYAIRSKWTVNPKYLLYALLGYYVRETPDSIRSIITREQRKRKHTQ